MCSTRQGAVGYKARSCRLQGVYMKVPTFPWLGWGEGGSGTGREWFGSSLVGDRIILS